MATEPVVLQNRRSSNFELIFRTISLYAVILKLENDLDLSTYNIHITSIERNN